MSEQAGYGRMMDGLSRDDQEKMPFGYVSAVTLCRDANGRVTAEWPNGARGCLISCELRGWKKRTTGCGPLPLRSATNHDVLALNAAA